MANAVVGETGTAPARRKARVIALQVLYEMDEARHDALLALERRLQQESLFPSVKSFARRLVEGVLANRTEIDEMISTLAPAWPHEQMAIVDKNILRVAIFEIRMGGETSSLFAVN